jgi:two-component system, NarL family, nitrate/nitrite response regulator NarL
MTNSPIRVCLIEDHIIVRAGLKILIEGEADMNVAGEAADRKTSLEVVAAQRPDILVVDFQLPGECAVDFLEDLLAINNARAIILTGSTERDLAHQVMRAGAAGLVYKDETPDVLIRAIRAVHNGEAWFTRAMMTTALSQLRRDRHSQPKEDPEKAKIATLTPREKEIIFLIANGLSRQEVAQKIFLSDGTVRNHLSSIFAKLEVSNQLALVFFAQRHGLDKAGDKAGG